MKPSHRLAAAVCAALVAALGSALAEELPRPVDAPAGGGLEMRPLSGPRADVAALILGGRESGSLRVAALAVPTCAAAEARPPEPPQDADGQLPVSLWIEIEAAGLLDAIAAGDQTELPESVRVELYAYVMTRAGEIVASRSEWTRIPVVELASSLPGGGVKLGSRLRLPPGEYQLRALVREARSQSFALRVVGVAVPDPGRPALSLSPPLFPDAAEGWLVATPAARGGGDRASAWSAYLPSALPVVSPDRPRAFSLRGCGLAGSRFEVRLTRADGSPVTGAEVRFEPPREEEDHQVVAGRIRLPEIEPGLHLLEVTAAADGEESTTMLPLFVTAASRGPADLPWTAIGGLTADADSPGDRLDPLDRAGDGKQVDAIISAYRRVLQRMAMGRREEAAELLQQLESEVVGGSDKPHKAAKLLGQAQNRVTRELLDHDPETLLPLLLLHLEMQSRYTADDEVGSRLLLAARSRVRALAQVYASEAKSEMAPVLAAMSLVEMAEALERAQQRVSALIVLREAMALDPANPDLLLDLAYQYENNGFHREARMLLQRLLEVEPRSDEGRLRLAISQSRSGLEQEGVELLRQLIRDGSTEWVLAVAYQELGHFLLRHRRPDDAVRLLREAVTRLPEVQRLYIELVYALDRTGQRELGQEVAERMPAAADRPSPRLLYRVAPPHGDNRSRSALMRHGTARLPLLAVALAAGEEAG